MKHWLFLFGIIFICLPAHSQSINLSTSDFGSANGSGSAVGTTSSCNARCGSPLNVPTGALLVAGVRGNKSVTLNSVTDTAGDTFVHLSSSDSNTSGNYTSLWYVCSAVANTSESFTANFSGNFSNSKNITVAVYTGAASSCPDGNGAGANGNSTSPATGNLTTAGANELLVGYFFCAQGGETAGSGFTQRQNDSAVVGTLFEDKGNGGGLASGTYTTTGTCTSGVWGISGALFIAAPLTVGGATIVGPSTLSGVAYLQ